VVVPDVPINQTWQDSLDAWVLDMSCRGFSATTIRSRKSAGKVLARTLIDKGRLDPAEVTRSDMTSYVLARQQGSTGPEGAVTHYSNISSFWKWWTQDTEGAVNPLLKVAAPRAGQLTPPSVLTDDELERLLHACEGSTLESGQEHRDHSHDGQLRAAPGRAGGPGARRR
jgi:site-specific recombinase XerD